MNDEIKHKVKNFISTAFLIDFEKDADEETNLFHTGVIDSFGFTELINHLEKNFQIKLTDEDLVTDALTSVSKIANCVKERINART
jgi:acyl carrier protein